MGISLNKYMTRRQREAGLKRMPVSSAAQEPVKTVGEAGGFSLDRYMSARRGGSWDIGGPNKGYGQSRNVGTALPGGPQAGGDKGRTGETAGPYKEQGQPTAAQPMTLYELQNPKWKRVMQDMTDPVSAFGLTEKQAWELNIRALERKLSDAEGKLEALRESEQKAQDWVDAARFHAADDYDQAEAAFEKAKSMREETRQLAAWYREELKAREYAGLWLEEDFEALSKGGVDPKWVVSSYPGMTEDELLLYNYLIQRDLRDGTELNKEYGRWLGERLARRAGEKQAKDVRGIENPIARTLATGAYGVSAGLDRFARGFERGVFGDLAGDTTGAVQYGSAYIREDLKDTGPKIFGNSLGQMAYDAVTTTANMAPSILLSSLTAGAGAPAMVAQGVGAVSMGVSAGGNAYNQALREGYSKEEARNYSLLIGASEAGLQYLLGGVGALGGKLTGAAAQMTVRNIDNALLRVAAEMGANMFSEGAEEYLQDILEPAFRNLCFDEHNEIKLVSEDAAYSFLLGAITAGLLEGGRTVSSNMDLNKAGAAVRVSGQLDALMEHSLALDPKSEAATMAAQMRTGALHANDINVGQLLTAYAEVGGSLDFMLTPQAVQETAAARPDGGETVDPDTQAALRRTAEEMQASDAEKADAGTSTDLLAQVIFGQEKAAEMEAEYRATKPQNVEMPTVPLIDLSTKDIPGIKNALPQTGKTLRKDAILRARNRLGLDQREAAYIPASNVTRDGNEYVLKITNASLKKMLNPADGSDPSVESIVVMDNLECIANNGVYFDSKGDREARPQIPGWDHLKTTVYIDGVPYSVDMRVKLVEEKPGNGIDNVLYYYSPEEILKIEKVGPDAPAERHAPSVMVEPEPTSDTSIHAAERGVKSQFSPEGDTSIQAAPEKQQKGLLPMPERAEGPKPGRLSTNPDSLMAGLAYDPQYADAVTRRGGLTEDGKKGALRPGDFEKLDELCRELGVHARFADGGEVLGGAGNASISGREIVVARDHQGALRAVLGHELTHRLQELAPEEYNAFRDIVAADDAMAKKTAYAKELYASRGIELDDAGALDEVTADYAGALIENTQVLEEFIERHRENKSLLEKLLDAIRGIIAKLTGAEKLQAQTAEGKLAAALDAAAANVAQGQTTAAGEQMAERFVIRYDRNNTPFVEVETDILAGVPQNQWVKTVKKNLKTRFPQGVDVSGRNIKINAQTTSEITSSEYSKWLRDNSVGIYADKFRATDSADEILLASKDYVDEGLKHKRKDNIKEFARGTVQMRIGGRDYTAEVVVATTKNGSMVLYDLVNIRPTRIETKKQTQAAATPIDGSSDRTPESAPVDRIPQTGKKVKRKLSLKDPAGFNEDMVPQPEQSQNAALAYDIQRMRRLGATLGENGARALAAVYDETLAAQYAPEQVAESFIQIYNATLNGRRLSEAAARKAAELPDYIRLAAEDSAQRDLARAGQAASRGPEERLSSPPPEQDGGEKGLYRSERTDMPKFPLFEECDGEIKVVEQFSPTQYVIKLEPPVISGTTKHFLENLATRPDRIGLTVEAAQDIINKSKIVLYQTEWQTLKFISDNGYALINLNKKLITAVPEKLRNKYKKYLGGK